MSLLGISSGVKDITRLSSNESIEQNDLYFLWKINKKNNKEI